MGWSSESNAGHSHDNLETLEKFHDHNGVLFYNGAAMGGGGGSSPIVKPWYRKTFNIHGDSVAAGVSSLGKSYADLIKNEHQFLSFNSYAQAGYNMGQIYNSYITQNKNVDLVLLTGGGNVFSMGTIDDTSPTTFYGAMNSMIQWHFVNMPAIPLMIITTHQVRYIRDVNSVVYNNDGTLRYKRSHAMLEIAKKYSLPVIHLWDELGITAENANTFTTDGTHPTASGYRMIARLVNKKLYEVTPEWYM